MSEQQQKVLVRVNQNTAGLGDVGSTFLVEDTDYVRLCAQSGVVSIVDQSPGETPSNEGENLKEPQVEGDDTDSDDDGGSSRSFRRGKRGR